MKTGRLNFRFLWHYNLKILAGILFILLLNMLLQGYFTWRSISDEQRSRQQIEADVRNEKVDVLKKNVERIVSSSVAAFEQQVESLEQTNRQLLSLLQNNKELLGASVAFKPNYLQDKPRLYAPYVYREGDNIRTKVLTYDYTTFEWYQNALGKPSGSWTKPYAVSESNYTLMMSYSVPLHNSRHQQVAVFTVDLPMSQLNTIDNTPYQRMSNRTMIILAMQVFSILLILFISYRAFVDFRKKETILREQEQVEYEMSIAQEIQKDILPYELPQQEHLRVSATLQPAEQVSGDFYDYRICGDSLCFCIGDIATKGMGAAMAMVVTWTAYRASKGNGESLADVIRQMNKALTDINEQQMFATFFAGELNLQTGMLTYCNAGHLAPVVLTAGGEATPLDVKPNVPLGLEDWVFEQQSLQMQAGDTLYLYTDGVTEAMNEQEGVFGDKRLMLHLRNAAQDKDQPEAIVKRLTSALHHHVGVDRKSNDDMTMLAIQYR